MHDVTIIVQSYCTQLATVMIHWYYSDITSVQVLKCCHMLYCDALAMPLIRLISLATMPALQMCWLWMAAAYTPPPLLQPLPLPLLLVWVGDDLLTESSVARPTEFLLLVMWVGDGLLPLLLVWVGDGLLPLLVGLVTESSVARPTEFLLFLVAALGECFGEVFRLVLYIEAADEAVCTCVHMNMPLINVCIQCIRKSKHYYNYSTLCGPGS